MISLTDEIKTAAQQDIAAVDKVIAEEVKALNSLITAHNRSRQAFWNFTDDRLAAMLNEIGAVRMQRNFTLHETTSALLNQLAEAANIEARATIGALREIAIDNAGLITVLPLAPRNI